MCVVRVGYSIDACLRLTECNWNADTQQLELELKFIPRSFSFRAAFVNLTSEERTLLNRSLARSGSFSG